MKTNAPKRKVFQDALDLLSEDPVKDTPVAVNGICITVPGCQRGTGEFLCGRYCVLCDQQQYGL